MEKEKQTNQKQKASNSNKRKNSWEGTGQAGRGSRLSAPEQLGLAKKQFEHSKKITWQRTQLWEEGCTWPASKSNYIYFLTKNIIISNHIYWYIIVLNSSFLTLKTITRSAVGLCVWTVGGTAHISGASCYNRASSKILIQHSFT